MSDDDRSEPLSSQDMIERARGKQTASSDELLQQAKDAVTEEPDIEGLDNIEVKVPVADTFPEPIRPLQTSRPRRVERAPTQLPKGPISNDQAPKAVLVAIAAFILLIAAGVAFAALATGGP